MKKTQVQPGVTVVIPTFNRAQMIGEAIDSVVSQDFEPLEVIVVDDGSTDDTQTVIAHSQRKSKHPIRVIRQANSGESAARNAGILEATHDLVAFLDSDNRWRPGKLTNQVRLLTDGEYEFTFTAYSEFGPDIVSPRIVRVEDWHDDPLSALRKLLVGCVVNTSTVIARRDVLLDVGLFDRSLPCCADHDLWLKIAAKGHRFGYLDAPLTDYRLHQGSVSQQSALVARNTERVIERLFEGSDLPEEIEAEESVHLARCYLNSACRYIEARRPQEARRALWKAIHYRPASIRPGWLRLLFDSLLIGLANHRGLRRRRIRNRPAA